VPASSGPIRASYVTGLRGDGGIGAVTGRPGSES
jgi:hypothetical protein